MLSDPLDPRLSELGLSISDLLFDSCLALATLCAKEHGDFQMASASCFFIPNSNMGNYSMADRMCKRGAHDYLPGFSARLARVNSQTLMDLFIPKNLSHAWIGMKALDTAVIIGGTFQSDQWRWMQTDTVEAACPNVTWHAQEVHVNASRKCMSIDGSSFTAVNCDTVSPFICEFYDRKYFSLVCET